MRVQSMGVKISWQDIRISVQCSAHILRYNLYKMLVEFLQSYSQISGPGDSRPWLLGVSGGADSLCLLHLMRSAEIPIIAAHFNHQLRQRAEADAVHTARIIERLKVPFILGTGNVRLAADEQGISMEAAARRLRYAFLFEQAHDHSAQGVVVAHTADDQVETVLLHLLRGSGTTGLQGMPKRWLPNPWSQSLPLIRPLLFAWKQETLAYCAENQLEPVFDETNLDVSYTRNRVRYELIPAMERFNPAIRQAVLRLAEVAHGEQELIQPLVEQAWLACSIESGEGYISLDPDAITNQPVGLRRMLLRRALAFLRTGLADIDFELVERLGSCLEAPAWRGPLEMAGGLRAWKQGNRLWLATREADLLRQDWPQILPQVGEIRLTIPAHVALKGGWLFTLEAVEDLAEARRLAFANRDPYFAWLDLDLHGTQFTLRPRWAGARFQPLGMAGRSRKISDIMIDMNVPQAARAAWPLLCAGERILWVPGLAAGHAARLTEKTQNAVLAKMTNIIE